MRFFVDSANLKDIEEAFDMGFISGVTTNPTLIHKENPENQLKAHLQDIRSICDGEILAQVITREAGEMVRQALLINSWIENVTVKIPLTKEGLKAISILRKEKDIRTCTTITFSPAQALVAAQAGATYVAPFYNRTNKDTGCGQFMVQGIKDVFTANQIQTKILAASIDSPMDMVNIARIGVNVITAPLNVWNAVLQNTMTDGVLNKFLKDWKGDEF